MYIDDRFVCMKQQWCQMTDYSYIHADIPRPDIDK